MSSMTRRFSRRPVPVVVYDQPIDVNAENDSHALMLRMISPGSRVLEFGCSTGRMTEILRSRGCTVTGIEIDQEAAKLARVHAQAVHIVDLDSAKVSQRLSGQAFDEVVFGDVLEHLRDPAAVLKDALKLLTPGGSVVISIPNMAHADIRLAMLEGRIDYGDWGLLDRTHLRWFTRDSLQELLANAGLEAVQWQRTIRPVTGSEIAYQREAVPKKLLQWLQLQPEVTTYQFVVQAKRLKAVEAAPAPALHTVDWAGLENL